MEVAGLTRATPESEEGGLPSAPCGSGQEGSTCYLARYFQPAVGTANAVSPRLAPASRADSARQTKNPVRGVGVQGSTTQSRPRCPFNQAPCPETLVLPLPPRFADALRRLTLSPPPPSHHAPSHALTSTAIHRRRTLSPPPPHRRRTLKSLAPEYDWTVSQWLVARTS